MGSFRSRRALGGIVASEVVVSTSGRDVESWIFTKGARHSVGTSERAQHVTDKAVIARDVGG